MKLPGVNLKLQNIKWPQMTKSQLILSIIVIVFLLMDLTAGIVLLVNKNKSAVRIVYSSDEMSRLYALDSAATKGTVSNEYANFKFTQEQKEYFYKTYQEKGSVALTADRYVTVGFPVDHHRTFVIGFTGRVLDQFIPVVHYDIDRMHSGTVKQTVLIADGLFSGLYAE